MNKESDKPKSRKRNKANTRGQIIFVGIVLLLFLALFAGKDDKGSATIESTP